MRRRLAKKISRGTQFNGKMLRKFNDDWDKYMAWRKSRWSRRTINQAEQFFRTPRHVEPIDEDELLEFADELAGNHEHFNCFVWFRDSEIEEAGDDPSNWGLIYTSNRDSRITERSNAAVIRRRMAWFANGDDPDVVFEDHSHWACGSVYGFSIRVFAHGKVTRAVRRYFRMKKAMENYPILDEHHNSELELEETYDNIKDAMWKVKNEFVMPEDESVWQSEIYEWLNNNEQGELENTDDQGGYPSEESLRRACEALGYEPELELV